MVVTGSGAKPSAISPHSFASIASVPKTEAYRAALASTRFANPSSNVGDCCAKIAPSPPNVQSSIEQDEGICHTDVVDADAVVGADVGVCVACGTT